MGIGYCLRACPGRDLAAPRPMSVLKLTALRVYRRQQDSENRLVVDGLSCNIEKGERVAIVGPNGAGKTSLLLAVVGAVPFEGEIEVGGLRLNRKSLQEIRRKTGFVFADPSDQLFLPTVEQEVRFGPEQRGLEENVISGRTQQALQAVGLSGYDSRSSSELSLGEQRRLAVATVLSTEPDLILLDEPTASLDPVARRQMLRVIEKTEATVVLATHDLDAAVQLGARVLLLKDGKIHGDGPAALILADEQAISAAGLEVPLSLKMAIG